MKKTISLKTLGFIILTTIAFQSCGSLNTSPQRKVGRQQNQNATSRNESSNTRNNSSNSNRKNQSQNRESSKNNNEGRKEVRKITK